VVAAAGFALGTETGVVLSNRRAATLGIGFFFLGGSSVAFCELAGLSLTSWRSFFSMLVLLGGSRRSCVTVGAFALENLSFTTRLESASSLRFGGSIFGVLPFTGTVRIRGSALTVSTSLCVRTSGTAKVWLLRSDEDVEAFDSARLRLVSRLSSSACIFEGSVGERISGSPYGLLDGS
jgi:hypothetical protein